MTLPALIYDEAVMQTLLGLRGADRTRVMLALKQLKVDHEGIEPSSSSLKSGDERSRCKGALHQNSRRAIRVRPRSSAFACASGVRAP